MNHLFSHNLETGIYEPLVKLLSDFGLITRNDCHRSTNDSLKWGATAGTNGLKWFPRHRGILECKGVTTTLVKINKEVIV